MNRLKETLGRLEVLCLVLCDLIEKDQDIIDQCVQLKRLEIEQCTGEYKWLHRKYPTLEYLKFIAYSPIVGISMFLERNPNIRKFATNSRYFWSIRDLMLASNIKLDELAIIIDYTEDIPYVSIIHLLNELHERGFHKRLQLYIYMNQERVDQIATVSGLVILCGNVESVVRLSALKNLEEIAMNNSGDIADLKILASNCINLERISFNAARIEHIIPLIRQAAELQKIKLDFIRDGMHFNSSTNVLDLYALNRERERLTNACKTTLYVKETIYLATKWALKETDLGLIRLKRSESFEWRHHYFH